MDQRHHRIFNEQVWYSKKVISQLFGSQDYYGKRILELGCAEGGGLHYFARKGADCQGIEYSHSRFLNAVEQSNSVGINIIHGDILNPDTYKQKVYEKFDYIIIRDVIEHLEDKVLAFNNIMQLLRPGGKLFISFPPKYSPYAGHQQNSTIQIGRLPYIFLIPNNLYNGLLKIIAEREENIDGLLAIKRTRISIHRFEQLCSQFGLKQMIRQLYLLRPCYEFRYGWKRIKNPFGFIPIIREITTLGALYVLKLGD